MITELLITLFLGGAAVGIAVLVASAIKEAVKAKFPKAFKILIKEKKKKAVKVGIFDNNRRTISNSYEISADEGVSDDIYVGQEIYV